MRTALRHIESRAGIRFWLASVCLTFLVASSQHACAGDEYAILGHRLDMKPECTVSNWTKGREYSDYCVGGADSLHYYPTLDQSKAWRIERFEYQKSDQRYTFADLVGQIKSKYGDPTLLKRGSYQNEGTAAWGNDYGILLQVRMNGGQIKYTLTDAKEYQKLGEHADRMKQEQRDTAIKEHKF